MTVGVVLDWGHLKQQPIVEVWEAVKKTQGAHCLVIPQVLMSLGDLPVFFLPSRYLGLFVVLCLRLF